MEKKENVVVAYKGFTKELKCRDFQYEVGKEYEEPKAEACNCGFHACEYPLDVFSYYPPASSRYCAVEQSGDIDKRDADITCSTKIKIGAEIGIADLVKAAIEYTKCKCTNECNSDPGKPATAGELISPIHLILPATTYILARHILLYFVVMVGVMLFLRDAWLSAAEVCKALLSSRAMETIAKTQPKLFAWIIKNDVEEFYFHAVKICNRNNYLIDEPDLWLDLLADLTRLNLDTRNSYYVCPADIGVAHEVTQRKLYRLREKEEAEELRKDIYKFEKAYSKHIAPYINIVLRQDDIVITPLRTVQDVFDEGQAMHHCVFKNEYYKKKSSLLLSARNSAGRRIETIELSLKSFEILQSRAIRNSISPYHKKIAFIINNNIDQFRIV